MTCCPACGAPKTDRHSRGPLTTQLNPPAAWWHGKPVLVTGMPLRLLHMLCRHGKVSHFGVSLVATADGSSDSLPKVVVHNLRRRLPDGLIVRTIFGWGYELVTNEGE